MLHDDEDSFLEIAIAQVSACYAYRIKQRVKKIRLFFIIKFLLCIYLLLNIVGNRKNSQLIMDGIQNQTKNDKF